MNKSNEGKYKEKKETIKKIVLEVRDAFLCFFGFLSVNYKETQKGSFVALCVSFGILAARMLNENLSQTPFVAVLLFFLSVSVAGVLLFVGEQIVKALFKINLVFIFYWVVLFFVLKRGIYSGCLKTVRTESIVIVIIFSFMILIFCKSVMGIVVHKRRTKIILIIALISGIFMLLGSAFFLGEGFKGSKADEYKELVQYKLPDLVSATDSMNIDGVTVGPFQVEKIEYGVEPKLFDNIETLESKDIDLSMYVSDADGLYGIYRNKLLHMDLNNAKLKGIVWYPEEQVNCPILFIMHGNHTTNETSHDGYDYLGEYLASYGYLVVSVDENILNTLSGENDARAILFLENMELIEKYTKDEDCSLYNKGDFSKVAIAGHSRGGESASITYLFNQLDYYTQNGMRKLDFDFNIQSIIAIAPSLDQFKPADHSVELKDVNYLLLQGANDQDIYGYMGMTQFENIQFTGEEDYIKSSLYIVNANHGQFNTKWGRYDMMFPNSSWLNVKNLMDEEEQQQIAKTMIKTFLDVTILGDEEHKALLYDYRMYEEILPETLYIQQYNESSQYMLCDFEEDLDLKTGTIPGVSITAIGVGIWSEMQEEYTNLGMSSKTRQNHVLKLKWTNKKNPFVRIEIPEMNLENQILTFAICDADIRQVEENEYELLTCEVVLTDSNDQSVALNCEDYAILYPPIPTKLGKVQYLTGNEEYKIVLQTVRIPISDFEKVADQVDFQSISSIEIHIRNKESGEVYIDKIGLGLE